MQPRNNNELQRRTKAQYITDELPQTERIDFEAITRNILSYKRLVAALKDALDKKRQQQEDEAALATMMLLYNHN